MVHQARHPILLPLNPTPASPKPENPTIAHKVFDEMPPTIYKTLHLGHSPSQSTLCKTLTWCTKMGPPLGLLLGTQIHSLLTKTHSPISLSDPLSNSMISMYGCSSLSLSSALSLFNHTPFKTAVSWNSMISAFSNSAHPAPAFSLFSSMLLLHRPTPYTFSALIASAPLSPLLQLLSSVLKSGSLLDLFVGSAMAAALARAGLPGPALHIFRHMACRNAVSLNGLMAGLVGLDRAASAVAVFVESARSIRLNRDSFAVLLTAVSGGEEARGRSWAGQVHAIVLTTGLFSYSGIGNRLVQCYSRLGLVESALAVFELVPERDPVSWNSVISCLDQNGRGEAAAGTYSAMRAAGFPPSKHSLISSLAACSGAGRPSLGRQIHCEGVKTGLTMDVSVSNSLVRLYAGLPECLVVFSSMPERDLVSWNSIIGASPGERPAELLVQMMRAGWWPNRVTFINILSAVSRSEQHGLGLGLGLQIHAMVVKYSLSKVTPISNALLSLYGRCYSLSDCERVFSGMGSARDEVSFNSMVSGYVRSGDAERAVALARLHMAEMGRLDRFTLATVLSACTSGAALDRGMQAHCCYLRMWRAGEGEEDVVVGSAIVDMYGKCGRMDYAARFFDRMRVRNLYSWNSVICGYARNGPAAEALRLFEAMAGREQPDEVTFVGVLSACGHAGMVGEGMKQLRSMTEKYSLSPRVEHFSCVADLLARSGELEKVEAFIEGMPVEGNALIWRSVLAACCRAKGRHVELGRRAGRMLIEMEPEKAANYVLLANMYAAGGRWDGVAEAWSMMREAGVRKEAGCSWVRVRARDGVHVFVAGDRSHPEMESIEKKLQELGRRLKEEGYVSQTQGVTYDVELENKEESLRYHSERLALAFALTKKSCMDIRIMKNLRVCDDCHSLLRHVSKLVGRRIVLRDSNRFHYFVDGDCSCRDYW